MAGRVFFAGRGGRGVGKEGTGGEAAEEGVVGVVLKVWVGTTPVRRPGREREHNKC